MWAVQRSVESHLISLLLDPSRTSVRPQGWEVYMSCERHFPVDALGYAYSGLSGRVSHTLSLRGPCFTVDTACSATAAASQKSDGCRRRRRLRPSQVVALDCASQALRLGRCLQLGSQSPPRDFAVATKEAALQRPAA